MRGQSLISLLEYEAKRRPEIQALVDNVLNLTDAQIEQAVVPLPWFKQALRQIKDERLAEARKRAAEMLANKAIHSTNPDPMGKVAYWLPYDAWFNQNAIGTVSLLVVAHFPLWFPDSGGVWVDTAFFPTVPEIARGLSMIRESSMTEYREELRTRRGKL